MPRACGIFIYAAKTLLKGTWA